MSRKRSYCKKLSNESRWSRNKRCIARISIETMETWSSKKKWLFSNCIDLIDCQYHFQWFQQFSTDFPREFFFEFFSIAIGCWRADCSGTATSSPGSWQPSKGHGCQCGSVGLGRFDRCRFRPRRCENCRWKLKKLNWNIYHIVCSIDNNNEEEAPKELADFRPSGKLVAETLMKNGVVLKVNFF